MNTLKLTEVHQVKGESNVTVLIHMHTCTPSMSGISEFLHTWKFLHILLFADKSCVWMS